MARGDGRQRDHTAARRRSSPLRPVDDGAVGELEGEVVGVVVVERGRKVLAVELLGGVGLHPGHGGVFAGLGVPCAVLF